MHFHLQFPFGASRIYRMKININDWVESYEQTGKLPQLRIPCNTEGCDVTTTCFGSNLANRISKTDGGLRTLLSVFTCRSCRTQSTKVVEKTGDVEKTLKRVAKATNRRPRKKSDKAIRIEELKEAASTVTVNVNAVPVRYNFKDPVQVEELTNGTCQRPDIYLNNDRACDGCALYEHCACSVKQLLADTGRRKVATGPRRKK